MRVHRIPFLVRALVGAILLLAARIEPAAAQWVVFEEGTATHLLADPSVGRDDVAEKDYAWGDVDRDGDIDLVVVRKEPFTSPGKRTNVLLLNEDGVLVDRTLQYATLSTVQGDQGFLTPTNDRDVALVDVNNDTWLDIVTATTISDGDPKHIGHPRVYLNLGLDFQQEWLGFRHEDARMPTMLSYTGADGFNPRFCSIAAGDVDGDDFADLWFGDYDSSGAGGFDQPSGADYNDRLLLNQGGLGFIDGTATSFSGDVPGAGLPFDVSAFGAAGAIVDMDGDGRNDIVKQTSLTTPMYVGVAYNDPLNEGFFDSFQIAPTSTPYFVSAGDLNNDGLADLVITDDGADRYLLNQGPDGTGGVNFAGRLFTFDGASDDGFGGNSVIADLNNDGWRDVLITDVDVDISGCSRRMHVYRNLGGQPGGSVDLRELTSGEGCETSAGNPASCEIVSIPSDELEGIHDVAVFDLNGDGWEDLVLGRCDGTRIYLSQPPDGLGFSYPQGLPLFVGPGQTTPFQVQVSPLGPATPIPDSARMFVSTDGGPFAEVFMTPLGGELYDATLPPAPSCTSRQRFYFTAKAVAAGNYTDPPNAPAESYEAIAAFGTRIGYQNGFEGDASGWSVVNDPALTSGGWEQAVPNGTLSGAGEQAAPDEDAEAAVETVTAFVTGNGSPGGDVGEADVDGGPTDLLSPPIDLSGTDGTITYTRWFFSDGDDVLTVWVSGDGSSWELVESVDGSSNSWQVASFRVGDFITPTATVQVRFRADDSPNDSITEAGIDLFRVEEFSCSGCSATEDCDDGLFCTGAETCAGGFCIEGFGPCPGLLCDEDGDACVECFSDTDCDDGSFCNGAETCSAGACGPGFDPCPGGVCDEVLDACVTCLVDLDCDDGVFCNGFEVCSQGSCAPPLSEACPGQLCNEVEDRCLGNVRPQARMGMPLTDLASDERMRFDIGRVSFGELFTEATGLGPIFNQNSCASCHGNPTAGGSSGIDVTRFGFNDDKGGGFDPLEHLGGSLMQSQALDDTCRESVPPEANVTARRVTPSVFGAGLIEAIPDAVLQAAADSPPNGVSGRTHLVEPLEAPGTTRVGRFGWKAQVATVLTFSGDATLNEMGITNRLLPDENAPNGDAALLAQCDAVADPEDGPDTEGFHFIDRVTDFQRFLAAPPQTPRNGMSGEVFFVLSGCNACHTPQMFTADDPGLETALRNLPIKPYSDFLLHDMGSNADFIAQGDAESREVRTPPLWGLRVRDPMWHDGRVAGGTFEERALAAIDLHDALGSEARASAITFRGLPQGSRNALVAFLDSLGRAEFDHDGDNDVDADDFVQVQICVTGPGDFYDADDVCAISDVDQDGDVDIDDLAVFYSVSQGESGAIPEGSLLAGRGAEPGDVLLSWEESCAATDVNYVIYEGTLGDYTSHRTTTCTTGGVPSRTVTPIGGSRYFLVAPTNGFKEGSLGADSTGNERAPGVHFCFPQSTGACDP